jgi:hypothetical protein
MGAGQGSGKHINLQRYPDETASDALQHGSGICRGIFGSIDVRGGAGT